MEKICYCPVCGRLRIYDNDWNYSSLPKSCTDCQSTTVPFTKKYKNAQFIGTEHTLNEWPRKEGEPISGQGFTPAIYDFFWMTYIDTPQNDKLDRKSFEAYKKEILDFFAQGGWDGTIKDLREKPSSKDASVIGRGVVGGIAAGPVGAVVGALSAVDKNMKNNNSNKK